MEGVTWLDLKTKRIPQYVLGVINKNNCWLTGKAYGRFKMHGHSHSIAFFFKVPLQRRRRKDRLQKNLQPEKPFDEVFPPSAASCYIAYLWALVIQRWLNVIRAIGCLRSFFNALLRTQYICCANKYKISVPVGSVCWEWVICLAYERCIYFHSGLFISRLLAACGFRDGTHHLSVPKQMCWRRPDWSVRMGWAAEPC